jgi:predicted nucleotidyltransferase
MKTKTKNLTTKWGIASYDLQKIYETIRANKKVKSVILFGSRAKGNYRKGSDIDLAIQTDNITIDELLQINSKNSLEMYRKAGLSKPESKILFQTFYFWG